MLHLEKMSSFFKVEYRGFFERNFSTFYWNRISVSRYKKYNELIHVVFSSLPFSTSSNSMQFSGILTFACVLTINKWGVNHGYVDPSLETLYFKKWIKKKSTRTMNLGTFATASNIITLDNGWHSIRLLRRWNHISLFGSIESSDFMSLLHIKFVYRNSCFSIMIIILHSCYFGANGICIHEFWIHLIYASLLFMM